MNEPRTVTGEPAELEEVAASSQRQAARRTWLMRLAVAIVIAALLYGLWYLVWGRNQVSTDNAYVTAEVAQVTPLISASTLAVHVKDTQFVRRGAVLVELDPARPRIAVAQAEADLAATRRRFMQAQATNSALAAQVSARGADIAQARARLAAAQAELAKARSDLARREALAGSGAVSAEELSAARNGQAAAQAALKAAESAVAQAGASREAAMGEFGANDALVRGSSVDTDPAVKAALARLDSARIDLANTTIRAPIDGVVTRRQIQIGQRVEAGRAVMTIVPLDKVYVEANFKERQLRRVRVGQPAEVRADIYGADVIYKGKVAGLSGGTGASMAIIPAQNATGNWIKVVQRLPVRIELDPAQLARHPLRVGLSMEVTIDVSQD